MRIHARYICKSHTFKRVLWQLNILKELKIIRLNSYLNFHRLSRFSTIYPQLKMIMDIFPQCWCNVTYTYTLAERKLPTLAWRPTRPLSHSVTTFLWASARICRTAHSHRKSENSCALFSNLLWEWAGQGNFVQRLMNRYISQPTRRLSGVVFTQDEIVIIGTPITQTSNDQTCAQLYSHSARKILIGYIQWNLLVGLNIITTYRLCPT